MELELDSLEARILLLSAFRYALDRHSYVPSVLVEIINNNLENIDEPALDLIAREIEEYSVGRNPQEDIDLDKWLWLRSEILKYLGGIDWEEVELD